MHIRRSWGQNNHRCDRGTIRHCVQYVRYRSGGRTLFFCIFVLGCPIRIHYHILHTLILRSKILTRPTMRLSRGAADEEPLVNGAVNLGRGKILVGRKLRQLIRADAAGGVLGRGVGASEVSTEGLWVCGGGMDSQSNAARGSLAGNQALPGLGALADNVHGVAGHDVSEENLPLTLVYTHSLFLHSPVKANWFSGLPSGIL